MSIEDLKEENNGFLKGLENRKRSKDLSRVIKKNLALGSRFKRRLRKVECSINHNSASRKGRRNRSYLEICKV